MGKNEKVKILELLIENRNKQYTIREIALVRNINYKSAYEVVKKLEKEGNIRLEKIGQTCLTQFNNILTNSTYLAEKNRLEKVLKCKDLKLIFEELKKINTQAIILLFGSYAKATQTKQSDIDLLVITEDTNEIERSISWIPKDIHITKISYKEFDQMLKSKEFSVVSEAMKNNIIFQGIEDYYRFLQNA
ncbi:MAG: nucleotidyltransferase domain-containing protein [Candidatus Woesearchaeota archaeon]